MKTPVLALLWTRELIDKDALCLFICFFSYNREERKVDKLLLFFRKYSDRLQASHIYDFK